MKEKEYIETGGSWVQFSLRVLPIVREPTKKKP
jgi:hypothetical protein